MEPDRSQQSLSQSSKPMLARGTSGSRGSKKDARDPKSSHYKGTLASVKYNVDAGPLNKPLPAYKKPPRAAESRIDTGLRPNNSSNAQRQIKLKDMAEVDRMLEDLDKDGSELMYQEAAQNRKNIVRMLDEAKKDAEELELESCFSELTGKLDNADAKADFDKLASKSMADMKADGANDTQGSFYKPNLNSSRKHHGGGAGTPQQKRRLSSAKRDKMQQSEAPSWRT